MKPADLSDIEIAFPASVSRLMPRMQDIPPEFIGGNTKWNRFQSDWFFRGISSLEAKPKDGIDAPKALRHLHAIQQSFEPKHEHKEASVAYLASLWFEDIEWTTPDRKASP